MVDERTLAFARELAAADEAAAATLAELDELAREVEGLRTGAEDLSLRTRRLPAEEEAASAAVEEAQRGMEDRRHALAAAEAALGRAQADETRVAEHAVTRARDALRMAERRLEAARLEAARLEEEQRTVAADAATTLAAARTLAGALHDRPALAAAAGTPPADDLAAVGRWATDARATLFVARGQLAAQREQLIRQANELAAAVLGEPVAASSAAAVARRVEATAD